MVSRMAKSLASSLHFVGFALRSLYVFSLYFQTAFLPTFASVFGLKWVPGAPLNPKMSARLAKSSPRLNFHQIFIDFWIHLGTLWGARGPLLGDLGHPRNSFYTLFGQLSKHFLSVCFLLPFFDKKSSNLRVLGAAGMWLKPSKYYGLVTFRLFSAEVALEPSSDPSRSQFWSYYSTSWPQLWAPGGSLGASWPNFLVICVACVFLQNFCDFQGPEKLNGGTGASPLG